jgi:hypothetical protein
MASPFDVSPPAWLSEIAKPVDAEKLGRTIGLGLMSVAGAFQPDPDNPDAGPKGLNKSIADVQMDQIDPQWRVKGQMLANQLQTQKMQMAEQAAWLNSQQRENSAWMEELPGVSGYLTTPPEKLIDVPVPQVTSSKGIAAVTQKQQQVEAYRLRKAQQDNTLEYRKQQEANREFGLSHGAAWQKHNQEVQEAFASLPAQYRAAIENVSATKGRNKDGSFTSDAEAMINDALTELKRPVIGAPLKTSSKLAPEVQNDVDEIKADEADLRRRITAATKADPNADVSDMEGELQDLKERRRALVSGKPQAGTAPAVHPEDKKLQHQLNVAVASGEPAAVKSATKAIQTAKKTRVLDEGGVILPTDEVEKTQAIANQKAGTKVWDADRGKIIELTQEMIDGAKKDAAARKVRDEKRRREREKASIEERAIMSRGWQGTGMGNPFPNTP